MEIRRRRGEWGDPGANRGGRRVAGTSAGSVRERRPRGFDANSGCAAGQVSRVDAHRRRGGRRRGSGLDLAVVEPHGTLRVWRLPSGGSNLEPVKLAGEDDRSSDRRVCSATWWSKGRLAFARHDGDVVVASVPDMSNALGEKPEAFDGSPALVTCPRVTDEGTSERVVVLETPPPEIVGAHRWRLATLNARSPREMLRAHLDAEEWGVATQLARLHGLDPDEVHKARWLASPPGKEALNDALAKVTDRAWAAAQCAAAVASTYEQQRFVLVYGLKETERRCGRNAEDETDIKWNWWTRLRLTLLAQLDRLDTLNAVHLGNHAPRAWASFRSETIGAAAVGFATAGNPRAAETILRRHPRAGGPSLLDALEALPETMSPSEYPGLMPWAQPWCGTDAPTSTRGARVPDWVEGSAGAERPRAGGGGRSERPTRRLSCGGGARRARRRRGRPSAAITLPSRRDRRARSTCPPDVRRLQQSGGRPIRLRRSCSAGCVHTPSVRRGQKTAARPRRRVVRARPHDDGRPLEAQAAAAAARCAAAVYVGAPDPARVGVAAGARAVAVGRRSSRTPSLPSARGSTACAGAPRAARERVAGALRDRDRAARRRPRRRGAAGAARRVRAGRRRAPRPRRPHGAGPAARALLRRADGGRRDARRLRADGARADVAGRGARRVHRRRLRPPRRGARAQGRRGARVARRRPAMAARRRWRRRRGGTRRRRRRHGDGSTSTRRAGLVRAARQSVREPRALLVHARRTTRSARAPPSASAPAPAHARAMESLPVALRAARVPARRRRRLLDLEALSYVQLFPKSLHRLHAWMAEVGDAHGTLRQLTAHLAGSSSARAGARGRGRRSR